jgi:hypothetical protein
VTIAQVVSVVNAAFLAAALPGLSTAVLWCTDKISV